VIFCPFFSLAKQEQYFFNAVALPHIVFFAPFFFFFFAPFFRLLSAVGFVFAVCVYWTFSDCFLTSFIALGGWFRFSFCVHSWGFIFLFWVWFFWWFWFGFVVRLLPSNAYLMGVLKKKMKEAQTLAQQGFKAVLVIVENFFI